jgi:hypothetical protein
MKIPIYFRELSMADLDDRRKGFEAKWAHDTELKFQVEARRDRMLGNWAAAQKGLTGQAAEDFATSVIAADLQEPGDEDVFRKLRAELDPAQFPDALLREKMRECLLEAGDAVLKAKS